jgi:hypothetical protein
MEDTLLERSFVALNPGNPICWSTTFAPCRDGFMNTGWPNSWHRVIPGDGLGPAASLLIP